MASTKKKPAPLGGILPEHLTPKQRDELRAMLAIGVPDALAHSAIRFGMGRFTTADDVDDVANRVIESVGRLRELSPLWELAQQGVDPTDVTWTPSD